MSKQRSQNKEIGGNTKSITFTMNIWSLNTGVSSYGFFQLAHGQVELHFPLAAHVNLPNFSRDTILLPIIFTTAQPIRELVLTTASASGERPHTGVKY